MFKRVLDTTWIELVKRLQHRYDTAYYSAYQQPIMQLNAYGGVRRFLREAEVPRVDGVSEAVSADL
jgi:hypothetical protein